jgi:hypothetical protein
MVGCHDLSKGWFDMVRGVWNWTVDGLGRYLMYGVGWLMDWKGAQKMIWFVG